MELCYMKYHDRVAVVFVLLKAFYGLPLALVASTRD